MTSLMDLPAELRNEIYKLALGEGYTYNLRERTCDDEHCNCLLFVSRQTRNEFLPMWRAYCSFELTTAPEHSEKQRIRHLVHQNPLAGFKHIQKLTMIEHLTSSPHRMSVTGSKKLFAVVLQINRTAYSYETEEIGEHWRRTASVLNLQSWMLVDAKEKAIMDAEMLVNDVLEKVLGRKLNRV
jgi:hypothetical protein